VSGRRPLFSGSRRGKHWRLLALAQQLDAETVRQVFTHSSWVSERGRSYERLEFLGDSVLSLAVTTDLYRRFPGHSEGHLARLRAYVVSRATCAKVAKELGLDHLLSEVGADHGATELDQLMTNQNVLADVTESLIGALYLTFGFDAVRPAVVEAFAEHIDYAEKSYVDFKTELQEQLAKQGTSVTYALVGFSGPAHERHFTVEAVVDGETLGRGVGPSKKRAEQEAAAQAMAELARREKRRRRHVRLLGPARKTAGARAEAAAGAAEGSEEIEGSAIEHAPQPSRGAEESAPEPQGVAGGPPGAAAPAGPAESAVEPGAATARRRGGRGRSRRRRASGEATEA
jgi:ribonuclease III